MCLVKDHTAPLDWLELCHGAHCHFVCGEYNVELVDGWYWGAVCVAVVEFRIDNEISTCGVAVEGDGVEGGPGPDFALPVAHGGQRHNNEEGPLDALEMQLVEKGC